MNEELASIRQTVDLSPQEALDSAEDFLTRQGYNVMQRTDTSVSANRHKREGLFGHSLLNLTVDVLPQPQGGVRIRIRGNDRDRVDNQRAEWTQWADSLPKKSSEKSSDEQAARRMLRLDTLGKRIEELKAEAETTLGDERNQKQPSDKVMEQPRAETSTLGNDREEFNASRTESGERGSTRPETIRAEGAPNDSERIHDAELSNVVELSSYMPKGIADRREDPEETVSAKIVETETLRLVNKKGRLRALLTTNEEDSPQLGLFDRNGELRVMMNVGDDSATLALADKDGHLRLRLAAGSNDSPVLDFIDSKGQLRSRLTIEGDEGASLIFLDENSRPRATFKEDDEGRFLVGFVDEDHKTRASFHMDSNGTPYLILRDVLGAIRCLLALGLDGTPKLGLFHEGEAVRASLSVGDDGLPSLSFVDNDGTLRATLRMNYDGSPFLSFLDSRGNLRGQVP